MVRNRYNMVTGHPAEFDLFLTLVSVITALVYDIVLQFPLEVSITTFHLWASLSDQDCRWRTSGGATQHRSTVWSTFILTQFAH